MGFFLSGRRQAEEDFRKKAEEKLEILDGLSRSVSDVCEKQKKTEEALKQLSGKIQRHDMTLEDYLESMEEDQEEKRSRREEQRNAGEEREKLLTLISRYETQLWQMRKFYAASQDSALISQLRLMEQAVSADRLSAGFCPIENGGSVNYELHEIISVRETADRTLDGTIAEIIEPGWSYRGKVGKRAKVSAYKYTEDK